MIYYEKGSEEAELTNIDIEEGLVTAIEKWGKANRILAIPPDYTRVHSFAGSIIQVADKYFEKKLTDIIPALGTHAPMSEREIVTMFYGVHPDKFRIHNWRKDVFTLGEVPGDFIKDVSEGKLNYSWPAQVNKILCQGIYDLILSVGQVVPHEVAGMANYNKNIFIGIGGKESINKSHFLGAVYGMERMMGRADTPVRKILNYASENFINKFPVLYLLTVVNADINNRIVLRGLFIGNDQECFRKACELSLKVNFNILEKPLKKVVVYLDPGEFKSTWLGNKSIYRTRMAIADGGELIILAPGVREFGEDKEIDRLIRKYGYANTPKILDWVQENDDLKINLSAAAHLIHGSSEGRFSVTYCPVHLTRKEIEGVNYKFAGYSKMVKKYDPGKLNDGINIMPGGEEIFYISNPALGLWACRERFHS